MRLHTQFSLAFLPVLLISGIGLVGIARKAVNRAIIDEIADRSQSRLNEVAIQSQESLKRNDEAELLSLFNAALIKEGADYVMALDPTGLVMAHTNVVEKGKRFADPISRSALEAGSPRAEEFKVDDKVWLDVAVPVWRADASGSGGPEDFLLSVGGEGAPTQRLATLRMGIPLQRGLMVGRHITHQLGILLAISGLVILIVTGFLLRGILRPVHRLEEATKEITSGRLGKTVPIPSAHELAALGRAFNRMSEALAQTTVSKDFLNAILRHMLDPLIVLDSSRCIRLINGSAIDLLGRQDESLVGQPIVDLWPAGEQVISRLERGDVLRDLELTLPTKDGREIDVLLSGSRFIAGEQDAGGIILAAKDMRERHKLEEQIRQSDKLSAVGKLASGVAHEINNPLGTILGFAQGILFDMKKEDPLHHPLTSIEREALRCKTLVADLLTFSRVPNTNREPINLNQAVDAGFSLIRAQARISHIQVEMNLMPELPMITGHFNQIQQIVINLANNSLDAMPEKGTLQVTTRLDDYADKQWALLEITDSGSGIPKTVISRIFEPFFTTKPVGQGTGLGLGLVHEIVMRHNGSIEVESKPGHTVFRIRFPLP